MNMTSGHTDEDAEEPQKEQEGHENQENQEDQEEEQDSEPEHWLHWQQQQDDTNDSLLFVSINQIDQNRECTVIHENIDHLIKIYINEPRETPMGEL